MFRKIYNIYARIHPTIEIVGFLRSEIMIDLRYLGAAYYFACSTF